MKKELGFGRCGLACCLCSENEHCNGCDSCANREWCFNRSCSIKKGINGCYECENNCGKCMLCKVKPAAFIEYIKRYGKDSLLAALERNESYGVVYHCDGVSGDYDNFSTIEETIDFIKTGGLEMIPARLIGKCGYYCGACKKYLNATCKGCADKDNTCEVKKCAESKGLKFCSHCEKSCESACENRREQFCLKARVGRDKLCLKDGSNEKP